MASFDVFSLTAMAVKFSLVHFVRIRLLSSAFALNIRFGIKVTISTAQSASAASAETLDFFPCFPLMFLIFPFP